jgi:glucose/mannose-6-phosphate isomerase
MDLTTIKKYDSQKMYQVYDKWPDIAREAFESNQKPIHLNEIKHMVFAGMGGSGAIGDLFAAVLSKTKIHLNIVKGYLLPKTVDPNTLVIIISVSGNTVESLSALASAKKIGCKIIIFTSGGKILEYAKEKKIEYRIIPQHHSPRASFVPYVYSILKVLYNTLKIKEEDILESISEMANLNKKINSSNLTNENPALNLAKWISGTPIIYYPWGLEIVAIRFRNSLQENSKIHTIAEDVIEACHNGIVAWERKSNVHPILIIGQDDYVKTKERWEILKKFFELNGIESREIVSGNGSILSKIINLIYLLDYSTIYKAVLLETDPSPVKSINFIKSKL